MVATKKKVEEKVTKNIQEDAPLSGKAKSIGIAIQQIEKQFGKGSIMRLGSKDKLDVEVIPTGALSLDVALGVGGIPKGRIIEIYGPESSGKTTLAMHIIAEAQKKGDNVAFVDAEHAFDPTYGTAVGININDMYIAQPDFGEQALEIVETLVRSAAFGVIVVDSVAALTPRAEIEGEMGASHMGLQARLMSQALRKITAICSKTGTTVIFLNQLRMKIGVMFGNPETTTGGNALKFYASIRLDIRQREKVMKDGELIGHVRKVKVVKNKLAPPFKEAEFMIKYPTGIDAESSIVDAAVQKGIIKRAGSWFSYNDKQLAQGAEGTANVLKEDSKLRKEIVKKVLDTIK